MATDASADAKNDLRFFISAMLLAGACVLLGSSFYQRMRSAYQSPSIYREEESEKVPAYTLDVTDDGLVDLVVKQDNRYLLYRGQENGSFEFIPLTKQEGKTIEEKIKEKFAYR